MAFYITADGYSDLLEEEDILNFYSNTVIQTWIADEHDPDHTTPERQKIPLEIEKCGDAFGDIDVETQERLALSEKYCIKDKSWGVKGSFISPEFKYIELQFQKCQNDTLDPQCKSIEEID